MNTQTQLAWAKAELKEHGQVTRNQALGQYITRLAARINDLREQGMNIVGSKEGKDYVYKLDV